MNWLGAVELWAGDSGDRGVWRLGRRIEAPFRGVGMGKVVIAGRKGVTKRGHGLLTERRGERWLGDAVHRLPFADLLPSKRHIYDRFDRGRGAEEYVERCYHY